MNECNKALKFSVLFNRFCENNTEGERERKTLIFMLDLLSRINGLEINFFPHPSLNYLRTRF